MTLIEMVQDILNDMDSDEVSSINDTIEALQVAQIIKTTYYEMIHQRDYDHLEQLFSLNAATVAMPTHMGLPDNVNRVNWIKYNNRESGGKDKLITVPYKDPAEFLELTNQRDSTDLTVESISGVTGVTLLIKNDKHPSYYTSFDDEYAVFDSYDSSIESNLQQSMNQCWGEIEPSFSLINTFTPDFPAKMFPGFLSEAKSTCFNTLKQEANPKEEQKSRRQRRKMSRDKRRLQGGGITYPNYGRS